MKNTTMSGQKISIRSKLRSSFSIYNAHKNKTFSDAGSAAAFHKDLLKNLHDYTHLEARDARILDLGCGQTASQTLLFHADGARVTGIDMEVPTFKMSIPIFWKVVKLNGMERALKSLARHILFDKQFFSALSKEYGKDISLENIDVRTADARSMPFDASTFDFIFSSAVFEHIDDVSSALKEVSRVLKPSGVSVISIHLYPSLSGGHCLDWIYPDKAASKEVPPWDHLLEAKFPANTFLNKLTINQYRDIFRRYTDVIKEETVAEGEKFLSGDVKSKLKEKGFSREDLLTRLVTFSIKKKNNV